MSRTTSGPPAARDLVRVAFGPSLVALVIIAAITLVQLVGANSDLTGTLGAIASMWLAVHQVPVTVTGQELGVLPLAPTALMVWATARGTAQITSPSGSWLITRWIAASAIGGPLFLAAIALAVVHDAASVLGTLQTPNALSAFGAVFAVHALGAAIGVGSKVGHRLFGRLGVPAWLTETIRPAAIGAAVLLALSGLVVAASLVVHWGTMHQLFGITDSFLGHLSLTVLSLLYLPNVVVGAAAVAVGSSAHIGFATFSAFTVFGGDIPALPILAAVPAPPLGPVWVALLIVGAVAGVALGQQCALIPRPLGTAFAKLAVSAALASAGLAVLAFFGSGELGNFGHVGVDQATFAPAAFFWFVVIGGMTVVMAGGISPRAAKSMAAPIADAPPIDEFDEKPADVPDDADPDDVPGDAEPTDEAPAEASPEPQPAAPPPPVRPAPDVEDVEDLMFVDDDIDGIDGEAVADLEPDQPPAGAG